ncbi:Rpn family recombination-promoting nuclease/putative transposase [Hyalangium versicolor]|uniref:Rpn family recombination-promoting nuclease/putative transposase n=1 Tax=Hyalangium versicolor TaxID=2861190 RepID=UPI001CCF944C|nr:Rpn family recombination-promoting nuclease/putative transposase [Hyalangium versicolor]
MSGPHDLFVRFTFENPERAEAELRAALPPNIVAQVDWSSLRRESGSVIDPELRETETDLLFSARLAGGQPLLVYLLLEHQSSVDRWMALRMLRYVVRHLENWRKSHPGSVLLPVVIPLVLYHGPDGSWSAPRRVEELFDVPGEESQQGLWRSFAPHFEYRVDDLTVERAEALMSRPGSPLVRLALLALRYGRSKELAEQLSSWRDLFIQVRVARQGVEELKAVFGYLFLVGHESARAATVGMLKSVVGAQRSEEVMDILSKMVDAHLREQGRLEGREEGRALGRAEVQAEGVLRILAARGVEVDEESQRRILSCADLATLDRWFDLALKATRLSDVLDPLAQ